MKIITWAVGLAGVLAFGGFVFLLVTTPKLFWNHLPVTALGAIVAACIAGVAALAATESVSSRRRHEAGQALNERRKMVYDEVIAHMIASFSGEPKVQGEANVRAMLSLWASTEVLIAYRGFIEVVNQIDVVNSGLANSAQKVIPPELKSKIQLQVAKVASAMRKDVMEREGGTSGATQEQIAETIFNDYSSNPKV